MPAVATDCQANGADDAADIANGTSADCNANARPNECDLAGVTSADCNADGVLDACAIGGVASDCNSNGLLDTCEGARVYVDASVAGGANDGTSWSNAYSRLREALAYADACVNAEIWVASGTYTPANHLADTFRLANNVSIYGGFAGGEVARDERDIAANVTTLSGDLAVGHNSVHVVTAEAEIDATGRLDGFRITGGRADHGDQYGTSGGALWAKTGAAQRVGTSLEAAPELGLRLSRRR